MAFFPAGAWACANCYMPGPSQPSLFYSGIILLPMPFLLGSLFFWVLRRKLKSPWEKS
jgi:hypothetical protein